MAYIKKTWVDVPDPSNPPSIPEGQDALARFDAANMNRIEDGVGTSVKHIDDTTKHITSDERKAWNAKAPGEHGLGDVAYGSSVTPYYDFLKKGCGFYQSAYKEGSPRNVNEWIGFLQLTRGETSGGESGAQIAFRDISPQNPQMWLKAIYNGTAGNWVEILHTGNAATLVPNAITKLPVSKGGTGATTAEEALVNLGVRSKLDEINKLDVMVKRDAQGVMLTTRKVLADSEVSFDSGKITVSSDVPSSFFEKTVFSNLLFNLEGEQPELQIDVKLEGATRSTSYTNSSLEINISDGGGFSRTVSSSYSYISGTFSIMLTSEEVKHLCYNNPKINVSIKYIVNLNSGKTYGYDEGASITRTTITIYPALRNKIQ
ncbi:MAG: hypothetical protein IKU75_01790 [Butyricimonas sp.]|nr:hypothetical protein [Butyricimonas sp.]